MIAGGCGRVSEHGTFGNEASGTWEIHRVTSLAHLLTPEFLRETWGMINR